MEMPETRYAKNDGVALAYQLVGQGGSALAYVPGFASNLELSWANPRYARSCADWPRSHDSSSLTAGGRGSRIASP